MPEPQGSPTGRDAIDVDRYIARIGYTGTPRADLETLRALTELHPAAITFEAVDVLLGRPVDISPGAIQAKLVDGGRGGYCFEQNGLLKRVLDALGFAVEGLLARVSWMLPPDAAPMPLTHMALRVTIDGECWLADVGFGACVAGAPLKFDAIGTEQPTRHETFRLTRRGTWTLLEAQLPDGWHPLYMLSPEPALEADYTAANWYTSTHPTSGFRRELRVARTAPDRRTTLMNNRLTVRHSEGGSERRFLDEHEIADALVSTFGLRLDTRSARQAAAIAASSIPHT
ncbi:MAG TPA: arylamine N-acetyltransferase [Steroidobacteraceae bacterium]|jgi:N-hydroxyarylamine O-acetyltransferase|nr:arylamine N-acetyltransferase [Steroidobacteraceae bacterium]